MKISNVVKGQITQTLMKVLLERAGYRVARFGIEELFQEVVHLSPQQYQTLGLSPALRLLPDLLVTDLNIERAFLVEVKFRSSITRDSLQSLHAKLTEQSKFWPEMYTVLLTSTTRRDNAKFHQDYIRVLRPRELDRLLPNQFQIEHARSENLGHLLWKKLDQLQEVFDRFHWSNDASHCDEADFVATAIKDLKVLSET